MLQSGERSISFDGAAFPRAQRQRRKASLDPRVDSRSASALTVEIGICNEDLRKRRLIGAPVRLEATRVYLPLGDGLFEAKKHPDTDSLLEARGRLLGLSVFNTLHIEGYRPPTKADILEICVGLEVEAGTLSPLAVIGGSIVTVPETELTGLFAGAAEPVSVLAH